jgi:hypothetical protein
VFQRSPVGKGRNVPGRDIGVEARNATGDPVPKQPEPG